MAKDSTAAVRLDGYDQLVKALSRLDKKSVDRIKEANQKAGLRVVERARQIAAGQPGVTSKLASKKSALRATKKKAGASVVINAEPKTTRWALGAEFGAKSWKRWGHTWLPPEKHGFQPWSGNQHEPVKASGPGFALYPAIREEVPHLEKRILDDIADLWNQPPL